MLDNDQCMKWMSLRKPLIKKKIELIEQKEVIMKSLKETTNALDSLDIVLLRDDVEKVK